MIREKKFSGRKQALLTQFGENMIYENINWPLLASQKLALLSAIDDAPTPERKRSLEGLLNLLDALQDDAHAQGFPVVFLTEEAEQRKNHTDE